MKGKREKVIPREKNVQRLGLQKYETDTVLRHIRQVIEHWLIKDFPDVAERELKQYVGRNYPEKLDEQLAWLDDLIKNSQNKAL